MTEVKNKVDETVEEVNETKTTKSKKTSTKKIATRKKAIKIDLNEMIPVRSVTKGGLTYISPKTGLTVIWDDYNTVEFLEFGELLTMKASKGRFLTEPYVVIDDEEVAEKLGLTGIYENMIDTENLEDFYKQSIDAMREQLEKLPRGIKKLIADKSRELVQEGKLFDIRKIKLIEEKLAVDLQILMD